MSGKQGELSPGNMSAICQQLPCLCLICVLWVQQGGKEV